MKSAEIKDAVEDEMSDYSYDEDEEFIEYSNVEYEDLQIPWELKKSIKIADGVCYLS